MKSIADTVKSREEEFSVRDSLLQEQWQKEDDRQHLLRAQRLQQLKALEEDARREAMQEDIAVRMQRLQMDRDAKVSAVVYSCTVLVVVLDLSLTTGAVCMLCAGSGDRESEGAAPSEGAGGGGPRGC